VTGPDEAAGETAGTPPSALTIGGTDSGGGAGIAADLRTFAAHGVHGTLAVAAVTAQDTVGVRRVEVLAPSFLVAQVETVVADLGPVATKTGFLGSPGNAAAVSRLADSGLLPGLVVDPVLVSSSGDPLFEGAGMTEAYLALVARATVVTPNLPEAELLVGHALDSLEDVERAARALAGLGPSLVYVKGGRRRGSFAVDVVFDGFAITRLSEPFVETPNVHGTGDTLSAAITAGLALGEDPLEAAIHAKGFVQAALARSASWRLGEGHGPIDQLHLSARRAEARHGAVTGQDRAGGSCEGAPKRCNTSGTSTDPSARW
jgi:hydroxymethylpyrimidine/phosphomethylpyrimidine kinase